jgi:hypothetical protein
MRLDAHRRDRGATVRVIARLSRTQRNESDMQAVNTSE